MSGIETVALVLGVLPLLVSAVEHYEDCFRPFLRYKTFAIEANRYQKQLKIQKTIFRNECRILLENVIEHDVVIKMLDKKGHPLWRDEDTEKALSEQLGSSSEACRATVLLIEERLIEVSKESQNLDVIVDQEKDSEIFGDKAWRRRVSKKLRFSISKSRLDENLSVLKSLNDDFGRLSAQTSKLGARRACCTQRAPKKLSRDIEKFQAVKKASQKLFEALSGACTKHTEHLAHFCVEAKHVSHDETSPPQIQFNLAFTHLTLTGTASAGDPIWFVIESILGDRTAGAAANINSDILDFTQSLKRQNEIPSVQVAKKSKKCVRFQSPTSTPQPSRPPPCVVPGEPLPNLRLRRNFCNHLRDFCHRPPQSNACVGLLEDSDNYRHLVYFSTPTPQQSPGKVTSLKELMSFLSRKGHLGSIPQFERLRLARSLAIAVLQYHATPWLKGSWRSGDIYFFGVNEKSIMTGSCSLSCPHLNVRVRGPDGLMARSSAVPPRAFAPNPVLFGLGVVLTELAYTAPLQSLQQPSDHENGENKYTEFFVAKRLGSSIGREMGSTYGKIVKKCLQCDFGCGDDLNDPELQAGFYREVICELEILEQGFRAMQLGM